MTDHWEAIDPTRPISWSTHPSRQISNRHLPRPWAWMPRTTPHPPVPQESGGYRTDTSTTLRRVSDKTPLPTLVPPLLRCNWLCLPRNEPKTTMPIVCLRQEGSCATTFGVQPSTSPDALGRKSGCPNGIPRTSMPRRCEGNSSDPLHTMAVSSAITAAICNSSHPRGSSPA